MDVQLAQVNIARMKAPFDDPVMAGFVGRIGELNALADASPGFVWRLPSATEEDGYHRPYDDDRILFNLSVWQTVEALRAYAYGTVHAESVRRRYDWFEKFDRAYLALWWIPAGHRPSIDEAKQRLAHLDEHGPSPIAFTFKQVFPPTTL